MHVAVIVLFFFSACVELSLVHQPLKKIVFIEGCKSYKLESVCIHERSEFHKQAIQHRDQQEEQPSFPSVVIPEGSEYDNEAMMALEEPEEKPLLGSMAMPVLHKQGTMEELDEKPQIGSIPMPHFGSISMVPSECHTETIPHTDDCDVKPDLESIAIHETSELE